MSRHPSPLVAQRHEGLLQRRRELTAEPPCWGDRRLWASLHVVERRPVHKQRVRRVMREHRLLGTPPLRLKATRTPGHSQPKPIKPHAGWGIEMTKGLVQGLGWVSSVVVLDWSTTTIVGHYAGRRCTAPPGLLALDMAVNRQFPEGVQGKGLSLMRDHGWQPTSTALMRACGTLGIQQALPRDNHPQGNADTERVIRTLHEEGRWRHEWTCPFPLASALETWFEDDNEPYLHSALGDKPPRPFAREDHLSHGTQFVAA
jgi:putative transposase